MRSLNHWLRSRPARLSAVITVPFFRPAPPSAVAPIRAALRRSKVAPSTMRNSSFRSLRISSSCCFSMARARESRSTPSRVKTCTSMTVPLVPVGTRREVSFTSLAFSPKMARSSFSSGVSWVLAFVCEDCVKKVFFLSRLGLALRGNLAHQDVAGVDRGTHVDDARLVQLVQRGLTHVRNVRGDLYRAELGVTSHTGQCLDVDG